MRRMPALLALFLVSALAACPATTPPAPEQPVKVAGTASPKAKSPAPAATATPPSRFAFTVQVKAPKVLASGTATLLDGAWEPVADSALALVRADTGRPINDAPSGKTGADGKARFEVSAPGGPVLISAKVGRVTLKRVYAIVDGGAPIVDPATTLVAAYFATTKVGEVEALDRIDAPRAEQLATRVRLKLEADATGVDLETDATAAAAYKKLLDEDEQLAAATRAAVSGTILGDDPAAR